jgi:hypothetical protein
MLPKRCLPSGEWLGDKFYVHALEGGRSHLWTVTPEAQSLGSSIEIDLQLPKSWADLPRTCLSGNRLFLFEIFGHKLDLVEVARPWVERLCDQSVEWDVISHLAPTIQFRLVASSDGRLFGIDSGELGWKVPCGC